MIANWKNEMKKVLAAATLSAFAFAAHADCAITSVRDNNISNNFKAHGGWTIDIAKFNQICEKLNRANARIQINAQSTVLVNQSVAWAVLTVVDRDTSIGTGDFATMTTQVNTYASQDKADAMMVAAINEAALNWNDLDKALASLENERKKVREAFSKKK